MCEYCECGDSNEYIYEKNIHCGFLGDIFCGAFISSVSEEYANEKKYSKDRLKDYDNKLHVSICTDNNSVDWKAKINYCPICGRKLGVTNDRR